ncbi:glycosyltransferase [Modestobacter sp. SYSU DS0511]
MQRPVVVLQSFPDPRPTTNPYIVMLGRALATTPGLSLQTFTWRRFLLGRFDVFHAHWPEILVSGRSRPKALVRQALFLIGLLRLRATRRPLVRTVHNLELPTGISHRERALLRLAERWTSLRVRINPTTELPAGQAAHTVLHGHYVDWFAGAPRPAAEPGRLAYVGLIRRYKGVERLLAAFAETRTAAPDLRLHVSGRPSGPELATELRELAGADDRVVLRLAFLSDEELVEEVSRAELVVLPYREMHNSGSVLTALSLGRPVLVPDNEANRALADEVGPGWVHRYSGEVTGADLVTAVHAARDRDPAGPDLSHRDWRTAGAEHLAAYRRALSLVAPGSR